MLRYTDVTNQTSTHYYIKIYSFISYPVAFDYLLAEIELYAHILNLHQCFSNVLDTVAFLDNDYRVRMKPSKLVILHPLRVRVFVCTEVNDVHLSVFCLHCFNIPSIITLQSGNEFRMLLTMCLIGIYHSP